MRPDPYRTGWRIAADVALLVALFVLLPFQPDPEPRVPRPLADSAGAADPAALRTPAPVPNHAAPTSADL